jgi:transglutaminase-like putative cysteine protease
VALTPTAEPWHARLLPRWPGWDNLPREARDTLFQLGVITWTVAPHLLRLPLWCTLIVGVVLVWRARLAVANLPLPNRWSIVAVLALSVALTWWTEGTLMGKEPGVTMLVILMTLKMLELRARRDALVVFFLGFFLVLTHFLYSQSLAMALVTVGSVWGLLTALVLAHMPVGRPAILDAGRVALKAALWSLPLMAVLFVLFPRISPLWGVPQDAAGRTGLSGSLRMGGVASLANDDSIAFRVRFLDGREPTPDMLYFRGPVLSLFDGREWTRLPAALTPPLNGRAEVQLVGAPLAYEMTLEPSRLPLLPLMEFSPERGDGAPQIDGYVATLRPDLQWSLNQPVTDRVRVTAKAWPLHRQGPRNDATGMDALRLLPVNSNPRTLAWAEQFRSRDASLANADARTLASALYAHIGKAGFTYTLEPGAYGRDAVDEFWLDRKLGFCEHFSVAFVVILRAWGVPARIVTGYQGADRDPVDGWYVVRNSHAHAWAEFWQPGEGWIRADPTAAVAPERIRRSLQLQAPRGFVAQAIDSVNPALMSELRAVWERFDNRWNQWILNYSRGRQFGLLQWLGFESPSWVELAYVLLVLLTTAAAAGAGWALWDRQRQDPWQRLQRRVQLRLGELGVRVAEHEPPRARAARVRATLGARGEALAAALDQLDRARYGRDGRGAVDRRWWALFRSEAAALKPTQTG